MEIYQEKQKFHQLLDSCDREIKWKEEGTDD